MSQFTDYVFFNNAQNAFAPPPFEHFVDFFYRLGATLHCSKRRHKSNLIYVKYTLKSKQFYPALLLGHWYEIMALY